ncbi:MAG: response regulator [Candidatus Magnetominusculus sp. LBB02]|nr:response regulator [Candidatus Magnetominusculus sp. LBB02]
MLNVNEADLDKISEAFHLILSGKRPNPIALGQDYPENEMSQAVGFINKFIVEYNGITEAIYTLSRGDVQFELPKGKTQIAQSLKSLQASLRNLTWVTQQIAKGDFTHHVDFMGEFSTAFNSMTRQLENSFNDRQAVEDNLHTRVNDMERMRVAMLNIMEDLQEARQDAEAASKAKADFLANMSHEIRTPMNAVIGMAHLALKTELSPKQRDYVQKILQSGQHLLGIINDILDFSKIEAGKLDIEAIDFDISPVLDNLATLVSEKAAAKGINLIFDIDPAVPGRLVGDPLRLGQILINYSNNAVKFTKEGEIAVRAFVKEEDEAGLLLRFEVRDTGIGLTEEQKGKLFQSFQQADTTTTRKYGGTGLGLAISKRLATLMGGDVGVESEFGRGSTFWFTARVGRSKALKTDGVAAPAACGSQAGLSMIAGARVLLVEDNELNQQVALELLADGGFITDLAENGEIAVRMACENHYDVVLMDMQMPVMDGVSATKEIRKNKAGLPIIAMTANAMVTDRQICLEAGMNDHVAKPISPDELFASLIKWIPPVNRPGDKPVVKAASPEAHDSRIDALRAVDGLDVSTALKRVLGKQASYLSLLKKFIAGQANAALDVKSALFEGRRQDAERIAHTAKGTAGNIGAAKVQEVAARLEHAIKHMAHDDEIEAVRGEFADTLQRLIVDLQGAMPEEKKPAAAEPADMNALMPIVSKLEALLSDDDSEAADVFAGAASQFNAAFGASAKEIETAIQNFDFEQALMLLRSALSKNP